MISSRLNQKNAGIRPWVESARGLGVWAWFFQRVTGVGLVFYLGLHIFVIHFASAGGRIRFDEVMARLESPFFISLDLVLLAVVLYHGLNGLRIVLLDFGVGVKNQAALFWVLGGIGIILFGIGVKALWPFLAVAKTI
ncbi:MAG: succinate dehydrogenase, cytochrome b556 subunit [Bacillota bacterium]